MFDAEILVLGFRWPANKLLDSPKFTKHDRVEVFFPSGVTLNSCMSRPISGLEVPKFGRALCGSLSNGVVRQIQVIQSKWHMKTSVICSSIDELHIWSPFFKLVGLDESGAQHPTASNGVLTQCSNSWSLSFKAAAPALEKKFAKFHEGFPLVRVSKLGTCLWQTEPSFGFGSVSKFWVRFVFWYVFPICVGKPKSRPYLTLRPGRDSWLVLTLDFEHSSLLMLFLPFFVVLYVAIICINYSHT